jgi:uncharacterized protein (DUF1684 family)
MGNVTPQRLTAGFVAAIPLLAAMAACNPPPPDEGDYVERTREARTIKDEEFTRTNDPVPASRKAELLPLAYFDIDPSYRVPAVLKPSPESPTLMMPTSTGSQELMRRVGQLEFTLHGKPLKLTAFLSASAPNADRLFVPFSDLTSGTETYPAGRYLDLDRSPTGVYEIDFNQAYNPFCYYNITYVCPLPPPENRLDVRIEAGEKIRT